MWPGRSPDASGLGGLGQDALRDVNFASQRKKPAKEVPKATVHVRGLQSSTMPLIGHQHSYH